jgi:hypothetical protein
MANYTTTIKVTEAQPFTISPKDVNGNAAILDANSLSIGSSDVTVLTVGPWGDGVHYKLNPIKAGNAVVTLAATSNGVQLTETIDVIVQPAVATTFSVVFKTPVPK